MGKLSSLCCQHAKATISSSGQTWKTIGSHTLVEFAVYSIWLLYILIIFHQPHVMRNFSIFVGPPCDLFHQSLLNSRHLQHAPGQYRSYMRCEWWQQERVSWVCSWWLCSRDMFILPELMRLIGPPIEMFCLDFIQVQNQAAVWWQDSLPKETGHMTVIWCLCKL